MDARSKMAAKRAQMQASRTNNTRGLERLQKRTHEPSNPAQNLLTSLLAIQTVKGIAEKRKRLVGFMRQLRDTEPGVVRLLISLVGEVQFRALLSNGLKEVDRPLYDYFMGLLKPQPPQAADDSVMARVLADVPPPRMPLAPLDVRGNDSLATVPAELLADLPAPRAAVAH